MTRFQIDLLGGSGRPPKVEPLKVGLAALPLLILLVVMGVLLAEHVSHGIELSRERTKLAGIDQKILTHAPAVNYKKRVGSDVALATSYESHAAIHASKQTAMTPLLRGIAESIPETLVVSKFVMMRRDVRKTSPAPDGSGKTVTRMVPERTVHLTVCDVTNDSSGLEIQNYITALKESKRVGPMIRDIRIKSFNAERLGQHDVIAYLVICELEAKE